MTADREPPENSPTAWSGPLPVLGDLVEALVEAVDPRLPVRSLAADRHDLGPRGRAMPWESRLEAVDLLHDVLGDLPDPAPGHALRGGVAELTERTWQALRAAAARRRWDVAFVHPGYQPVSPGAYETSGLGGNETSLVVLAEAMAAAGHQVTVYAECDPQDHLGVRWRARGAFSPETPRDAVVFWVTPDRSSLRVNAEVRAVRLGGRRPPAGLAEAIRCGALNLVLGVSRHQRDLLVSRHGVVGDHPWLLSSNGVRLADYAVPVEREPGKCLYSAAPYRGLDRLLDLWPRIRAEVPHAELYVTGGYQLWGVSPESSADRVTTLVGRMLAEPGVRYLGAVPKRDLRAHQLSAQLYLYPTHYEEMECVACVEAGAAGAIPVTSRLGALPERVAHGVSGVLVDGHPDSPGYQDVFVAEAVALLRDDDRRQRMAGAAREHAARYSADTTAAEWLGGFEYVRRRRSFTDVSLARWGRQP
ncbi:glycosyltransferase family 4 protein [Actinosynnema sp. NPDC023587]|uniref:glycosyltransferase family 4 protein n=1 Tax=Actinosynnema sp. NPDC023587 TaxID=3154695 RepID=UPI0033D5C40F